MIGYLGVVFTLLMVAAVFLMDHQSRLCRYCDERAIDGHAYGCPERAEPDNRAAAIRLFEAGRRHAEAGLAEHYPDEVTYLLGYRRGQALAAERKRQLIV